MHGTRVIVKSCVSAGLLYGVNLGFDSVDEGDLGEDVGQAYSLAGAIVPNWCVASAHVEFASPQTPRLETDDPAIFTDQQIGNNSLIYAAPPIKVNVRSTYPRNSASSIGSLDALGFEW